MVAPTSDRQRWFVPLRLTSYVMLTSVAAFWLAMPDALQLPLVVYSLLTLLLALSLVFQRRLFWQRAERSIVLLQFLSEIWIESLVISHPGAAAPTFAGLYLLTIASAALAYRLPGTLITASAAAIGFTWATAQRWLIDQPASEVTDRWMNLLHAPDHLFYTIFLHLLIFYLLAFIAGYLAERLSSQDSALAAASNALRRARLETDDILRHLNSGVISVDSFGRIIFVNKAAERILGFQENDIRGHTCQEQFAARMPELADALLDGVTEHRAHPRREIEIRSVDNRIVPVGLSTSVLFDDGGQTRGVIAIFSDLTEAKSLEAKIRATDRLAAVGELSAAIAHEIRNPLAAISGSVEVLQRELPLSGDNRRLMELIVKESHRLSKILSEFLTYARIDRPIYRKVELCHLVGDVIELLSHHHSYQSSTQLLFESDEAVAYVAGDDDQIIQLLLNLGLNACESLSRNPGMVRFVLRHIPDERSIELSVEDTGPGMDRDQIERAFQPFYSTKKDGTGLGLAIVHRLCESLQIGLALESVPGQGTRFRLRFPSFGAVEPASSAQQPQTA